MFVSVLIILPPLCLWQPKELLAGKLVKFGTLIDDTVNSKHTKFGVSNSNSLAPPLVQKLHFEMLITFEP